MSKNLSIWNELAPVQKTACKEFKRRGWSGTAVNPAWIMKRLTDVFGPVGKGWGVDVLKEEFVQGHSIDPDNHVIVHVVQAHLWYSLPNDTNRYTTVPQYGQTTFVGTNSQGVFTDEEAPKKSLTDAIGKCAVSLGLAADIYLSDAAGGGLWDGNKYINTPVEASPPPAEPKPATRKRAPVEPAPPKLSQFHQDVAKGVGVSPTEEVPFDATGDDPLHGKDWETWGAEDWSDLLETIDPSPETLLRLFTTFSSRKPTAETAAEFERTCGVFADVFRVICEGASPERTKLLSLFKKQRKLLDSLK